MLSLINNTIKIFFCFSIFVLSAFVRIPLFSYDYSILFISCFFFTQVFKKNYPLLAAVLYIISGIIYFPVFTFGGGLSYLQEPTLGYLLALIPLAALSFYYKRACLRILLLAHAVGLVYLALSGSLTLDVFLGSSLYQLIYDVIFASIIVTILPHEPYGDGLPGGSAFYAQNSFKNFTPKR
jgi:biotin transporter BioY